MRKEDRESLVALYEDRYARFGRDIHTIGWNKSEQQHLRFKVLCDIADLSDKRILDFGCGFGDLIPYLEGRITSFAYTGVDISPSLISEARECYRQWPFHCRDILEEQFTEPCDYVLASGAFSFRVADNWDHTTRTLTYLFDLAEEGVAVNFLTSYVNFVREHNFHYDPERMFSFARELTPWVKLRHDYPLWEFTLYMYKGAQSG